MGRLRRQRRHQFLRPSKGGLLAAMIEGRWDEDGRANANASVGEDEKSRVGYANRYGRNHGSFGCVVRLFWPSSCIWASWPYPCRAQPVSHPSCGDLPRFGSRLRLLIRALRCLLRYLKRVRPVRFHAQLQGTASSLSAALSHSPSARAVDWEI